MLVRSGQKTLQCTVDQARIERMHRIPAKPKPIHGARPEILDQRIGIAHKVLRHGQSIGRFQIDADAAFVAVEIREEPCGETMQPARAVAVRCRLHADHIGAEICKHNAAGWPHHGVTEFENHKVRKRQDRHRNQSPIKSNSISALGGTVRPAAAAVNSRIASLVRNRSRSSRLSPSVTTWFCLSPPCWCKPQTPRRPGCRRMPGKPMSVVNRSQSSRRSGTTRIVKTRINMTNPSPRGCEPWSSYNAGLSTRPRQGRRIAARDDYAVTDMITGIVDLHDGDNVAIVGAHDEFRDRH